MNKIAQYIKIANGYDNLTPQERLADSILKIIQQVIDDYNQDDDNAHINGYFYQNADKLNDKMKVFKANSPNKPLNTAGLAYRKFKKIIDNKNNINYNQSDNFNKLVEAWIKFTNIIVNAGYYSQLNKIMINDFNADKIKTEILKMKGIDHATELISKQDLKADNCIVKYTKQEKISESPCIYLQLIDEDNLAVILTKGDNNQPVEWIQMIDNTKDNLQSTEANGLYNAIKQASTQALSYIEKDSTKNYSITVYEDIIEDFVEDSDIANNLKNELTSAFNEVIEKYPKQNLNSFEAVEVSIKMTYSHIDLLNKLMVQLGKVHAKFRFVRLKQASFLRKRLKKIALNKKQLLESFKQLFKNINPGIVAVYYDKVLFDDGEKANKQEDHCCGIVIKLNNIYYAIPGTNYSSFTTLKMKMDRIKQNMSFTQKWFNNVNDTIDSLFGDVSLENIIRTHNDNSFNEKLLKFLLKDIRSFKEFTSFESADKYITQETHAQYRYPKYDDTNISEVKETILAVIVTLATRGKAYDIIKRFILDNSQYILKKEELDQQLNQVPNIKE